MKHLMYSKNRIKKIISFFGILLGAFLLAGIIENIKEKNIVVVLIIFLGFCFLIALLLSIKRTKS